MTAPRNSRLLGLMVAGLAAVSLAACGGGSGGSTGTDVTATTATATGAGGAASASAPQTAGEGGSAAAPAPAAGGGGAHRAAHPRRGGGATQPSGARRARRPPRWKPSPREVRKAGHAAPFLVARGDNSVPTYGSEAGASERGAAEASLTAFLAARAHGAWSTACTYLAASSRRGLEQFAKASGGKLEGCGPALKAVSATDPGAAGSLTHGLLSLRVKDATGFALWVGPGGQKYAMPMAMEGGHWMMTQAAPLPYPPGGEP